MKKLTAILLALVCMMTSAYAEFDQLLLIKYNSAAQISGAPELDLKAMQSKDNYYQFDLGKFKVSFEMAPIGGVRTCAIFTDDESCTADFLCSCLAMTFTLGDIDTTAVGMLLMQYSAIRAGKDSTPYNIGTDLFQILSGELGKYTYIYMNNDAQTR